MKKKIIIITIIIFFIAVIGVAVYLFAKNIREDQALTEERMSEILDSYETFNKNIEKFANSREELYKMLEENYIENISENYQTWNTYIDNYGKTIKKVDTSSKLLKESCFIKYVSVEVNSKCDTFKANYEAAMNYYITDIKNYNENVVKKYNEWAEANDQKDKLLTEGKLTVYKDYIDFDKDKEYFGKENSTTDDKKSETTKRKEDTDDQ